MVCWVANDGTIGDEVWLSQRVRIDDGGEMEALNEPRPEDDGELSAFEGQHTAAAVYRKVRGAARRPIPPASNADGVRYARVGILRAAGFVVKRDPTRRNRDHLLIGRDGAWDDRAAVEFDQCFGDIVWHDESGGST